MNTITIPQTIYHYTTQEGLLGILKEHSLWASKIHYLNDASELGEPIKIARSILINYIQQLVNDDKDKDLKNEIANSMLSDIDHWARVNICLISFCTNGDLLSQWRGYGLPSSAYSIGFNTQMLIDSIKDYPFQLRRCQYYEYSKYYDKINQSITEFIKQGTKEHTSRLPFIGSFINMASTMKLDVFKEENEWRLISYRPLGFTDDKFKFRSAKSLIMPYYSLPFDLSSLVEIIIGPCQHPELTQDSVSGLAYKYDLKKVLPGRIKLSSIPYRVF